jgi:acyl-coenzyme A thioesterase PaaI-like protein
MTSPERAATPLADNGEVLADAIRRLLEVVVRTQAPGEDLLAAADAVDGITTLLGARLREGPWSPDHSDPQPSPYNTVVGVGNPVAAPVELTSVTRDGVRGVVRFGTAYEGAPGLVHGGVLSMVMDQMFGEAGVAAGVGGMTVRLEIRYAAPTPVHADLEIEAHVEAATDRLVTMAGTISCGDTVTVHATATFFRLTEAHAQRLFPHLVRE